ncbi:MAG: S9 family peptidase [Planctomycetes bacterium]|nr:S9 family peptidase [Planctomycetota bacterium]
MQTVHAPASSPRTASPTPAPRRAARAPECVPASRFFATRQHGGFDLSPDGESVLAVINLSRRPEIWRIPRARPWPEQLTFAGQRINQVHWAPDGRSFAFTSDHDGDEQWRLFTLPVLGGEPRAHTPQGPGQHFIIDYSRDSRTLYVSANTRDPRFFDLLAVDLATGRTRPLHTGTGLILGETISRDGRRCFGTEVLDNTRQRPFWIDLRDGSLHYISLPTEECRASHCQPLPDGKSILLLTDSGRDHPAIARIDLAGGAFTWLRAGKWDVEGMALSEDGRRLAWTENRGGNLIGFVGRTSGGPARRVSGPGTAGSLQWSRDGRTLAFYGGGPKSPAEIVCVDISKGLTADRRETLTRSACGGIPPQILVAPKQIRYRTPDGERIEAFWYAPKAGGGRAPYRTIVWMHGGPEWQELNEYKPAFQYFLHRGFALFAANFRGSTGRGRRFQRLIYRHWGEACYDDVAFGVNLLLRRGLVDPNRLCVMGGSYGGYMTLVAVTREPARWKAAVDVFGPSNLISFAESVPEHWKPGVHALVGHPEKDRAMLEGQSPLFKVDRIRCPLYVVQGGNDPRVRQAESEQIVAALRKRERPVEYLLLKDEGHGFARLENQIRVWESAADFLERHVPVRE